MRILPCMLLLFFVTCEGPAGPPGEAVVGPPGPAADVREGGFTIEAPWLPLSDHAEQGVFSAPAIGAGAASVSVYAAPPRTNDGSSSDLWYALPAAVPAPCCTLSYAWEPGALSLFLRHDEPGRYSGRLAGWRIRYVVLTAPLPQ